MHDYKLSRVQVLQPGDHQQRVEMCGMLLTKDQEEPDFFRHIIWSDEAKFCRQRIFNKGNNFWSKQNPSFRLQERNH